MTNYAEPAGNPQVLSDGRNRLLIAFPSQWQELPGVARGAVRMFLNRCMNVDVREFDVAGHWIWVHTINATPALAWHIWQTVQTALTEDSYPYELLPLPEPTLTTQEFCVCHTTGVPNASISLNLHDVGVGLKPAGIVELRECLPAAIGELTFENGILRLTRRPSTDLLEWVPAVTELLARLMELLAAVGVRLLIKFEWPRP